MASREKGYGLTAELAEKVQWFLCRQLIYYNLLLFLGGGNRKTKGLMFFWQKMP